MECESKTRHNFRYSICPRYIRVSIMYVHSNNKLYGGHGRKNPRTPNFVYRDPTEVWNRDIWNSWEFSYEHEFTIYSIQIRAGIT